MTKREKKYNIANGQNERIYWLDVARVLAIISITLNHAVNRAYDNYENTLLEFQTFSIPSILLKTVITVFSRYGVPIFLMISGCLLMKKKMEDNKSVKKFYKHNLLRLFITAEIWYFIMYWVLVLFHPQNAVLMENGIKGVIVNLVLTMLFVNPITFESMWYIPMILCVYMLIPILVLSIRKLPMIAVLLPLGIAFISSMLIPNINAFFSLQGIQEEISFQLSVGNLFSMYFIYVIAGYYISNGKLALVPDMVIGAGSIVAFLGNCVFQYWAYSKPGNYLVSYNFAGILIGTCLLFELLRRKAGILLFARRVVQHISKISFGIYFVHIVIMSFLYWYVEVRNEWSHCVQLIFLEAVSFIGSVIIISLLSKIPILKKYLFMVKD